jgi:hypothetical protein
MKKIMLIIAAVALIASPAMAVDWDFYGSARIQTGYWDDDLGDSGALNPVVEGGGFPQPTPRPGDDDDKTFDYSMLDATSRIGARVKGDPIQGRFEIRPDFGGSWRLLWGQWKINSSLRLRIGKDWTPLTYFYSGQQVNDAGMGGPDGAGAVTLFRQKMIQLIIGEGQNFVVAIHQGNPQSEGQGAENITIPVLQANYHFAGDSFFFDVGGAYWTYEVEGAGTSVSPDDDVTSWVVAGGGGINFGPAYFKGNAWYGMNVSEIGYYTNGLGYDSLPKANDNGSYKDTDSYGLLGVVGFRFTDQMAVEGGIGYENHDSDFADREEDEAMAMYAHFNYTAAPGVSIIPEIGYIDFMDDYNGTDSGDRTYFSIKWQIDF